jgi:hypothetical protein
MLNAANARRPSDTFRASVWCDVRNNWSASFPATPDGYGMAFRRGRAMVAKFGGSVAAFESGWPDLGNAAGTALSLGGGCFASVQWGA